MRKPFGGILNPKSKNFRFFPVILSTYFLVIIFSLFSLSPLLKMKWDLEEKGRPVALAVDGSQLNILRARYSVEPEWNDVLSVLYLKNYRYVVFSSEEQSERIKSFRDNKFRVIWKINHETKINEFKEQFQHGDGLFSIDVGAPGYPFQMEEFSQLLISQNGFSPNFEFFPQKGRVLWNEKGPFGVKAHILPSEEMFSNQENIWKARIQRAVDQRWVQLVYVQCSPVLDFHSNVWFLMDIAKVLEEKKFVVGAINLKPVSFGRILPRISESIEITIRHILILVVSVLTAILGIVFVKKTMLSPFFSYLFIFLLTLFSGLLIQALGTMDCFIYGVFSMRAVKLQLILPIIIGSTLLISKEGMISFLNKPLKRADVLLLIGMLGVLGVYLMRSGNNPIVVASTLEKYVRDFLDSLMGARPRFKEFLIGYPSLVVALFLKNKEMGRSFIFRYEFWLVLSLIGVVSTMNTFTHFHTPLRFSILRSVHGAWLGLVLGWLMCSALNYFFPSVSGSPRVPTRLRRKKIL
ncbi:MAG: DUF5693 family protein [Elusimicrobiota bacterium]